MRVKPLVPELGRGLGASRFVAGADHDRDPSLGQLPADFKPDPFVSAGYQRHSAFKLAHRNSPLLAVFSATSPSALTRPRAVSISGTHVPEQVKILVKRRERDLHDVFQRLSIPRRLRHELKTLQAAIEES